MFYKSAKLVSTFSIALVPQTSMMTFEYFWFLFSLEEFPSRKKKTLAGNSSKDEVNVDDDDDSDEIEEEEVSDEEEEVNEVAGDDEDDDDDEEEDEVEGTASTSTRNAVAPSANAGESKVEESKKSSIKEPKSHDS